MWREVLARLDVLCDLQHSDPRHPTGRLARLSRKRTRPDAWLFDGHHGPLPVSEPQVIQLHEAPWNEPESMATLEPEFLHNIVEPSRRAAAVASAIVCPSESSRRQIIEDCHVDPAIVFAAYHGVNHQIFHPGVTGGAQVAARHGADPGRPYILTVASIHPRKNLLALREAFYQLTDDFPHQLVIVGGPSYGRTDAEEQYAAVVSDNPEAPGRQTVVPFGISDQDMAALMCEAAAFCLPSLSEGFGLPAAEAMACGAPTVLADRAALKEVGQDAAVMVEPDAASIAQGLRSLLVDPLVAKKVGFACTTRAQAFSWDSCARTWFAALEAGVAAGARAT